MISDHSNSSTFPSWLQTYWIHWNRPWETILLFCDTSPPSLSTDAKHIIFSWFCLDSNRILILLLRIHSNSITSCSFVSFMFFVYEMSGMSILQSFGCWLSFRSFIRFCLLGYCLSIRFCFILLWMIRSCQLMKILTISICSYGFLLSIFYPTRLFHCLISVCQSLALFLSSDYFLYSSHPTPYWLPISLADYFII
jgi:hypothetical protein